MPPFIYGNLCSAGDNSGNKLLCIKNCFNFALSLSVFCLPVHAQTYSHEFVNPDGSSYMCSSDYSGSGGRTRCAKVPIDERTNHQKKLLKLSNKDLYCKNESELWAQANGSDQNGFFYPNHHGSFAMYFKCMGHCYPGSPHASLYPR